MTLIVLTLMFLSVGMKYIGPTFDHSHCGSIVPLVLTGCDDIVGLGIFLFDLIDPCLLPLDYHTFI